MGGSVISSALGLRRARTHTPMAPCTSNAQRWGHLASTSHLTRPEMGSPRTSHTRPQRWGSSHVPSTAHTTSYTPLRPRAARDGAPPNPLRPTTPPYGPELLEMARPPPPPTSYTPLGPRAARDGTPPTPSDLLHPLTAPSCSRWRALHPSDLLHPLRAPSCSRWRAPHPLRPPTRPVSLSTRAWLRRRTPSVPSQDLSLNCTPPLRIPPPLISQPP